jgi:sirohydrochlorin ferrochelatase
MARSLAILALTVFTAHAAYAETGLLILAHGNHGMTGHDMSTHTDAPGTWNTNVLEMAKTLNAHPTEVAFGMAEPPSIQAAVNKLEARGVTEIVAVPLFISSHSPIIGNFRYILGLQDKIAATSSLRQLDRVKHKVPVRMGTAMDADPIVSGILLDRARTASKSPPEKTTVVLIAHGPNDDGENRLWMKDMEAHAAYLRAKGGFRAVRFITRRDDAHDTVRAAAHKQIRAFVAEGAKAGTTVVAPVLISEGGIDEGLKEDLAGLKYEFAQPLLPHPNVALWVKQEYQRR